jgi:hypothetical protein
MDPQAAWERLLRAYASGDWDAIEVQATALFEWLDADGDPPDVLHHNVLHHLYRDPEWNRALARAGCVFALETVQSQWVCVP